MHDLLIACKDAFGFWSVLIPFAVVYFYKRGTFGQVVGASAVLGALDRAIMFWADPFQRALVNALFKQDVMNAAYTLAVSLTGAIIVFAVCAGVLHPPFARLRQRHARNKQVRAGESA